MMTAKKTRFCELYAVLGDGAKSAIGAGYNEGGARQAAYAMLQEPEVKARIKLLRDEYLQTAEISPESIIRELKAVAFSRLTDFMQIDSTGITLKDVDPDDWRNAALAEASEESTKLGRNLKIKLHPKLDALGKLMKVAGMDEPKAPVDDNPSTLESGDFQLKRRHRKPEPRASEDAVASQHTPT